MYTRTYTHLTPPLTPPLTPLKVICEWSLKTEVLLDEVQAGGRIPLIIGRGLTARARESLGLPVSTEFRVQPSPEVTVEGYTLAQKMVGRACGFPEGVGALPDQYVYMTSTWVLG